MDTRRFVLWIFHEVDYSRKGKKEKPKEKKTERERIIHLILYLESPGPDLLRLWPIGCPLNTSSIGQTYLFPEFYMCN
jgi:hypothetical protein